MPVFQAGSINTTALIVPDTYVQIIPPRITNLNGVPTNRVGVVGIATWGPVNVPTIIGDMAGFSDIFGPIQAKKFDLGTAVAAAVFQGANDFRCVRVTDGTDIAASIAIVCANTALATALKDVINLGVSGIRGPSNMVVASATGSTLTITSMWTGTHGNLIAVNVGPGSAANTTKVSITLPGGVPEVFDNVGVTVTDPGAAYTLANGTDGNTTISSTVLVGTDVAPRKGMYALRNTKCSIGVLADADDSTQYTAQVAFGLAEGIYMIGVGPVGQSIAAAVTAKAGAGIDSYAMKLLLGDWCYFQDTVNNQQRLISPQGFVAGRLANLSPEQSGLNKPIYGIIGTQASSAGKVYSTAELATLIAAGIDLITNPVPGGNYFGLRVGHNSSSNPMINGDSYTRMTNYIAYTIDRGMGIYDGRVASPSEREEAFATLDGFFESMANTQPDPMIEAYSIQLNEANNPQNRRALGYQQADIKVQYLGIVEKFIVNVEGGASVVVRQTTQQV